MKQQKLTSTAFEKHVYDSFHFINSVLEEQKRKNQKPIKKARDRLTNKTIYNLQQIEKVLCSTKYENLKKILLEYDRYRILIDFYIVSDNLKIDKKRVKKDTNKNKYKRFTNEKGDYYFALPLDKFLKVRGGTRNSVSKNINLFVFLGLIGKVNAYNIESYEVYQQELNRKSKILEVQTLNNLNIIKNDDKKIDFNFTSLYYISKIKNVILAKAEERASKLLENNFSIRAFTSLYLAKYFDLAEAERVYFNKNLLFYTEYSSFLQNEIKEAIKELVKQQGYANKSQVYRLVKESCVAHDFELNNKDFKINSGRHRVSSYNTFITEYKRITAEFLQENENIKLSSTPNKQMIKIFNLKDKQHIFYDVEKLGGNENGK